jgi:urease accessory protein
MNISRDRSASPHSAWNARLRLDYALRGARTVAHFAHEGPLRVLQSLYPEGDAICHNVLVHPPSGLVGGDVLEIQVHVQAGAHSLITTPGATRYYRSTGPWAAQELSAHVQPGARLEWLPLETIAYNDCRGINRSVFTLESGAELLAWDITALGLPEAQLPFAHGQFLQHMEVKGFWLDKGLIDAQDRRLMDGPLGLSQYRCLGTLVLACGTAIDSTRAAQALAAARECVAAHSLHLSAGVTQAGAHVLVLRVLAPLVEPAMELLRMVWTTWRKTMWDMPAPPPRIWSA